MLLDIGTNMDFHQIEIEFTKRNLVKALLRDSATNKKLKLSKSEKKKMMGHIAEYSSKLKFIPTVNYIVLGLLYDREKTLDTIRRKGILRYSKYLGAKNFPEPMARAIVELADDLFLDKQDRQYFESIVNLSPIYELMKDLQREIANEIKRFLERRVMYGSPPSLLRTLLTAIDWLFVNNYNPSSLADSEKIEFYSKEEIAEAISYLIYFKHNIYKFSKSDSFLIDVDYLSSPELHSLLVSACKLKAIQEFEIMIDHYSYNCSRMQNKITISPFSQDFEKSIRIGYTHEYIQKGWDFEEFSHLDSFEEIIDELWNDGYLDFLEFADDHNYPRYRWKLPEPAYKAISKTLLEPKKVYREEARYLVVLIKDYFLDFEKLNNIKISQNLSLFEFFLLKRVFWFFNCIFIKIVYKKHESEPQIILRSLVPSFSWAEIFWLYKGIVSEQAFNEFLTLVTWNPDGSDCGGSA